MQLRHILAAGGTAAVLMMLTLPGTASAQCTCGGGTDAWGNPIDQELVDCGTSVCGAGQTMYTCTSLGWAPVPGSVCNDPASPARTIYVDDCASGGSGTIGDPYCDLQAAIDADDDGDTLQIAVGTYYGRREPFTDPTCGNCEPGYTDPSTGADCWPFRQSIPVTTGFHVFGKSLTLRGASRTGTVLNTDSNYGLLFQYAGNSRVENLTVTGGIRSSLIEATDAGILARYTNLTIDGVEVVDNGGLVNYPGSPDCSAGNIYLGIAGVVGREGAILTIRNSNVLRNSWDAITLYQSDPAVGWATSATIMDNVIGDGLNPNVGDSIGVTHDASALIEGNVIRHTVKGVGAFGESAVVFRNNVIYGIDWWYLFTNSAARMLAYNNVLHLSGTGSVGTLANSTTSEYVNNVILGTGNGLQVTQGSFRYNNVTSAAGGNTFLGTNGNVQTDPGFVDAPGRNYALRCDSAMIDAGDPASSFNDPDGTRNDIGAYGGPYSRSSSSGSCCTCTGGSDYWGNPIDPASTYCGMQVCGGDNQYYECTSGGWVSIGGSPCAGGGGSCTCTGGSDFWGNPIDPASTYCGMQVCGGDNQYYECTSGGWNSIGGSPCAGGGGSCTCTGGSDYWGNPVDPASTYCGFQVCGGDNQYYECTAGGWASIGGSPCAGGGGGNPSGRITAQCGFGVPLPFGHTAWSPAGPCEGTCYSSWTDGFCTDPADFGSRIDVYGCPGKTSSSGYSCDGNHNGGVLLGTYASNQQVRFSDFWNDPAWCTLQMDVHRPSGPGPYGLVDFLVFEKDTCP